MRLSQVAAQLAASAPPIKMRQGVIDAVAGNTVSVFIGGSTVSVPGIRYADHVTPAPGDTVWLVVSPPDLWVIAKLA